MCRQLEARRGAVVRRDREAAANSFGEDTRQEESQAQTAARILRGEERLADALQRLRRHARALIGDRHAQAIAVLFQRDDDRRTLILGGGIERVLDEREDGLAQPGPRKKDRPGALGQPDLEPSRLVSRETRANLGHQRRRIDGLGIVGGRPPARPLI